MKFKFQCSIGTWLCSFIYVAYGCFCATTGRLSSCDRELSQQYGLQSLNYILSGPLQKKFASSTLDKRCVRSYQFRAGNMSDEITKEE